MPRSAEVAVTTSGEAVYAPCPQAPPHPEPPQLLVTMPAVLLSRLACTAPVAKLTGGGGGALGGETGGKVGGNGDGGSNGGGGRLGDTGGGDMIGQFEERYGGGPGFNSNVHSILGPRCTFASLPDRWRPVGGEGLVASTAQGRTTLKGSATLKRFMGIRETQFGG